MNLNNIEYYKCPITKKIFKEPVLLYDGYNYEKEIIDDFNYYFISPITHKKITKDYIVNNHLKSEIDDFFLKNPEYKKDIYKSQKDIIKIFTNKQYNKLLLLHEFNWTILNNIINKMNYIIFFSKIDVKILNHLIKIGKNIDSKYNNFFIIEIVSRYGNSESINLLAEKSINLLYVNEHNHNILSIACIYNTYDTIKKILEYDIPYLKSKLNRNWYPLHFACWYNKPNTVKIILDKYKNINTDIYILL